MGFVVSKIMQGKNMREAMELEYARRRELVKEACAGVRMEFAIGLFQNQSYGHPERKKIVYGVAMAGKPPENKEVADAGELKPRDWRLIFGRAPPEEVWHAAARSDFLIFMETLRPCALIGDDRHRRWACGADEHDGHRKSQGRPDLLPAAPHPLRPRLLVVAHVVGRLRAQQGGHRVPTGALLR